MSEMNEELEAQLRGSRAGKLSNTDMVRTVLRDGKARTYNDILIDVHKKYNVVLRRDPLYTLMNRLHKDLQVQRVRTEALDIAFVWRHEA
jgi:hypothetical protein